MHEALVLMRNLLQMCTYPFTSYFVKFLEQERLGIHLSWGSPYAFNQQIKCECMEINKDVYSQARTELEQIPTNPKSAKFSISSKVIDHILKPAKEIYCRYKKYAEESLCQQFIIHTWFQKEQKSPKRSSLGIYDKLFCTYVFNVLPAVEAGHPAGNIHAPKGWL